MTASSTGKRFFSLDILRGLFIFTMVLTHSIFFFHADSQPVLQVLRAWGDFISFTGLMIVSGAVGYVAYIHYRHPTFKVVKRLSRRLFVYLIGYYLIAIFGNGVLNDWQISTVWQIISFQRLVPFTEFIIPFIIFGFLKVPFRPLYDTLSRSWLASMIAVVFAYLLAVIAASLDLPITPTGWKLIIIGQKDAYSFPLLYYSPLYLLGIFIGRQFWAKSRKQLFSIFLKVAFVCLIAISLLLLVNLPTVSSFAWLFRRWPPSPGFLLVGSGLTMFFLTGILFLNSLKNFPWTRTAFIILGQNAFAILFTHTFILYTYKWLNFPLVHSLLLFISLWLGSLFLAIYLAKILPLNYRIGLTFINWCECQFWHCSHAKEHYLIKLIKRILRQMFSMADLFSLRLGGRRYSLFKGRHALVALGLLLATATPLGIAENELIIKNRLSEVKGKLNRHWFIPLLEKNRIIYSFSIPADILVGQRNVSAIYQIDQKKVDVMSREGNYFQAQISLNNLEVGQHQIKALVKMNNREYQTKASTFYVSAPVLVTWTIDWEGYDVNDSYLQAIANIADNYGIPMTHLFNPRIYTNEKISSERASYLTEWVKDRRDFKNEEIGMHLHMFPDLIEAAGVEPLKGPTWGGGFTRGYDILTTAYGYEQMKKILLFSKQLFYQHGLGEPRSYRAGGWFANVDTLRALQDSGFLVDSSGRTKYNFGTKKISGFWDLPVTAQPYYPSTTNQNSSSPPPQLAILEIPNNGGDSFAFTAEEMIKRFNANYAGGVSEKPTQITYLSHPHWFNLARQQAMNKLFSYISQWSYQQDRGPVIFTTLLGVFKMFCSNCRSG